MRIGWVKGSGALLSLAVFLSGSPLRGQTAEPATAQNPGQEALPVVAVRIVAQDGRVLSAAPADLPIALGRPLDSSALREALRQLFRTGDYADLQAVRTPVAGGLRLDFVVRENLFFNLVRIEGLAAPPNEGTAAAAMQINLGHPYRKDTVDEGLARLLETLQEDGLYEARVSAETIAHPETQQMDLVVHVAPGPRARTGEIHLVNRTGYADRELLERARFAPGRPVTLARLQKGSERLRKFLARKGYLSARVLVRRGAYDPSKKSVPLELEVTEGPRVRVVVAGAKFSARALKKLIPIYEEGTVDPDLLEEGRRNLRERLEREGYFDAEVSYTAETREKKKTGSASAAQEQIITYRVERGNRHKLVGVEISGNRYFRDEILRSRLRLATAAFASRGRFSRRILEDDAQSMQALYQANGFREARVEPQVVDNYKGREGNLLIRFAVQEGAQIRVAALALDGNHIFSEAELLLYIGSTPGQPFSEAGVAADRDNILALYYDEGFPEARFQASFETGAAPANRVRLTYHIVEGPQVHVRRIFYSGYRHTRPGVIRREVRLRPSQPLRQGEVVESQRRLYNLGVFNRVTIDPQNPAGSDPRKNVVVLVEETKRYTLAYGGGVEVQRLASTTDPTSGELRASPRGILELSKVNLTGRADSLSLKLRGSTIQGRALLGYSVPNTFGKRNFSFQATAYAEKTRDISTFSETRYEGSVQLTQTVTPLTTLLYRYAFRKVLVGNLRIPPQEVSLFNQPTLVSEFGVTWFRDRRNNPADATRGSFTSVDTGLADTGLGSSASFLRFFVQNSSYHAVRKRFDFARSARLGILRPYRDTVSLTFPAPTPPSLPIVIPLPERLFAGGGASLRGFALNQAGPRDAVTGFPVGGQAELILNQEFRFPMRVPFFGTQLGGAFFYDAGNIFSRLDRISLRWAPPKPVFNPLNPTQCQNNCANELNYFSHTIGFGVRYATPVGPIRVDVGYQLNRATFVIPCLSGVPNCQQAAQLPRIQFFFNLGAPF